MRASHRQFLIHATVFLGTIAAAPVAAQQFDRPRNGLEQMPDTFTGAEREHDLLPDNADNTAGLPSLGSSELTDSSHDIVEELARSKGQKQTQKETQQGAPSRQAAPKTGRKPGPVDSGILEF